MTGGVSVEEVEGVLASEVEDVIIWKAFILKELCPSLLDNDGQMHLDAKFNFSPNESTNNCIVRTAFFMSRKQIVITCSFLVEKSILSAYF